LQFIRETVMMPHVMEPHVNPNRPETEAAGYSDELEVLKASVKTHGLRVAVGVAVALVIVFGVRMYYARRAGAAADASAMLMSARSVQDLEALVEQYGKSPSAPLAMLKLAKGYFDLDNYDQAFNRYVDFLERYPEHALGGIAELGKLHCLEARGQVAEALAGFELFLSDNPQHFLEAQAVFGRARCLEQLDRMDDARIVYEDFIAANPNSGWVSRAEEMLDTMEHRAAFRITAPAWDNAGGGAGAFPALPRWDGGGADAPAPEPDAPDAPGAELPAPGAVQPADG
jgi:tetratricopeptide (TPR) repeat protein